MNRRQFRMLSLFLAISLVLVPIGQAMAQSSGGSSAGALTMPVSGTVVNASNQSIGQFNGSVTINRFAKTQTNQIVAVGIVRGVVTNTAGQVMKSGLQTIVLPVNLTRNTAVNFKTPLSGGQQVIPAALTTAGSGRFTLAQAPVQSCGILHLDIGGATAVNLLGFMVNLTPITLDISGDSAGPLGALVCEIVALLGTVADVVGLLNSLLSLLTGLLGGLTGGLGGGGPII